MKKKDTGSYKEAFRDSTMRTSFNLSLTQPMIEFLCAVADGVRWDRSGHSSLARPENFIASSRSLEKRGLIVRKNIKDTDNEFKKAHEQYKLTGDGYLFNLRSNHKLTSLGRIMVDLFKESGIFVESDYAIIKKSMGRT